MESKKHFLTKAEIADKLIKLATSPPPAKLSEGSMCYEMTEPPNRAEYICPNCGERTLYTDDHANFIACYLPYCRATVKKINCLEVKLDESLYCRKCSPNVTNPCLNLMLKYKGDQKEYKIKDIGYNDLVLLAEFCADTNIHKGGFGIESPLKDYFGRLQDLLTIKIDIE
jgi:hypothetical protein